MTIKQVNIHRFLNLLAHGHSLHSCNILAFKKPLSTDELNTLIQDIFSDKAKTDYFLAAKKDHLFNQLSFDKGDV